MYVAEEAEKERPNLQAVDKGHLNSICPELLRGLYDPYEFGKECGEKWVQVVPVDIIHDASVRLTANQQLKEYFRLHNRFLEFNETFCGDDIVITNPISEEGDICMEISDYFAEKQLEFFFFQGPPSFTEEEVTGDDGLFIIDVPNYHFRAFEDGWTQAVREHYKGLLINAIE